MTNLLRFSARTSLVFALVGLIGCNDTLPPLHRLVNPFVGTEGTATRTLVLRPHLEWSS